PEQLSARALRDDLRWFAVQQRALEAISARWLAELDRRDEQGPDADDFRRCTAWLREELQLTSGGDHGLPNLELGCNFHHATWHPENARFRTPARGSPQPGRGPRRAQAIGRSPARS